MREEKGYIVVETAGAFIPFVMLVISILSLVNIVTLQARIHYALTQTAGTLSMYSYAAHAAEIADEIAAMEGRANSFTSTVDSVINGINALSGSEEDEDNTEDVLDLIETATDIMADPADAIKNLANYGLSGLRNDLSAALITPLVYRYLGGDSILAYEYLSKMKVVSFEITDCVVIDADDNVRITADYEVLYTFGVLRMPFAPTLRISQTVVTKAWLGGSGEGYRRG